MEELIVDNFAGGGGASTGIELAIGRSVDIAINHDPAAIAMHRANHPNSKHYCENVWDVDPVEACGGRPVALCWFSPDCKHFSKAKGSKPVSKHIRGLAWVAVKWAKAVHPRVIMLENVEEFQTWGPLIGDRPNPKAKGKTFHRFVHALERCGYKVQYRELIASDYGAPTKRKRFFLIARCDGQPIVWPEPTHGDPDTLEVRAGILKPWKEAGDYINWNVEMVSIFDRKKPLCEKTNIRIAEGFKKFVVENPHPYIVDDNKVAYLIQYHGKQRNGEARGQTLDKPLMTIDSSNRYALVVAWLMHYYGTSIGRELNKPLGTITARGQHIALMAAYLIKYYGADIGQSLHQPLHTITAKDRFGLVVALMNQEYLVADMFMRMLTPRELFDENGFPHDYIIDRDADGKLYPRTAQVARCGNAVPPPFAEALTRANLPELCGLANQIA